MLQEFLRGPVPIELELLLAVIGRHLSAPGDRDDRVCALLARAQDWHRLVSLARRHRVLPLLHQGLNDLAWPGVPSQIRQPIQQAFALNLKRNLRIATFSVELLNAFSASEIRVIPFKGVFLAQSAYGFLSHRQVNDIDLLIAPADRVIASNVIESLGYCGVERLDQQDVFRNLTTQIEIDLHWELTPAFFPIPYDFERTFSRSRPREIAGTPYRDLCLADQLRWLSVQLTKDCWERQQKVIHLQKVCDLYCVIRQMGAEELEQVVQEAGIQGLSGVVHFSLILVSRLLGLRLPHDVEQRLQADARAGELARSAASLPELAVTERLPERNSLLDIGLRWRQLRFYMGLRESWRDQRRYLAKIVGFLGGAHSRRGRVDSKNLNAIWSGQLLTTIALDGSPSAIQTWAVWRSQFDLADVAADAYWVLPAVHGSLSRQAYRGPEHQRLAGVYKHMRLRDAVLQERLLELLESFRGADCSVLVGPPAAVALAMPGSYVPLEPIMLIVPAGEVDRADGVLRSAGCRPDRPLPSAELRALVTMTKYGHVALGEIELCWRPLGLSAALIKEAALWQDRVGMIGPAVNAGMPCAVDQALIIALRGSRIQSTLLNARLGVTWREIHNRALAFGIDPAAIRLGRGGDADERARPGALLRRHRARYASCPADQRPTSFLRYLRDYYAWAWQEGFMNGLIRAVARRSPGRIGH